jgi:hypothetical protein
METLFYLNTATPTGVPHVNPLPIQNGCTATDVALVTLNNTPPGW